MHFHDGTRDSDQLGNPVRFKPGLFRTDQIDLIRPGMNDTRIDRSGLSADKGDMNYHNAREIGYLTEI